MLTCVLCPNTKGLVKDIAKHAKSISLKAARGHRKKSRESKERQDVVASEGREEEWVAEPEPGVLITLSTPVDGCNRLKKIRFSEEHFDAFKAQKWWNENCDKIMELYTIHQENQLVAPLQSNNEVGDDAIEAHNNSKNSSQMSYESIETLHEVEENFADGEYTSIESSNSMLEKRTENRLNEWVVEDEPGVFVTVRALSDGSKEILRVELSRERFGEVKARVWWEENKARLRKQYS